MSRSSQSTSAHYTRSNSESTTRSVNSSPAANLKQQQPTHSSSSESHTPTQRAESEDSGTRNDKETDNGTSTKEAQLAERHLSTERPPNIRPHRAGVRTPLYDQNHKNAEAASTARTSKKMASRSGHANSQHTVNLTEAPTWYPATKPHADRALANRHTRGHPAGAHPTTGSPHPYQKPHAYWQRGRTAQPQHSAGTPESGTNLIPDVNTDSWRVSLGSIPALTADMRIALKRGDAHMCVDTEPEEVPSFSKAHYVERRQTIMRRSDTTVSTTVLRAPLTIAHSPLFSTVIGAQAITLSSPSTMAHVTSLSPSRATRIGDVA